MWVADVAIVPVNGGIGLRGFCRPKTIVSDIFDDVDTLQPRATLNLCPYRIGGGWGGMTIHYAPFRVHYGKSNYLPTTPRWGNENHGRCLRKQRAGKESSGTREGQR